MTIRRQGVTLYSGDARGYQFHERDVHKEFVVEFPEVCDRPVFVKYSEDLCGTGPFTARQLTCTPVGEAELEAVVSRYGHLAPPAERWFGVELEMVARELTPRYGKRRGWWDLGGHDVDGVRACFQDSRRSSCRHMRPLGVALLLAAGLAVVAVSALGTRAGDAVVRNAEAVLRKRRSLGIMAALLRAGQEPPAAPGLQVSDPAAGRTRCSPYTGAVGNAKCAARVAAISTWSQCESPANYTRSNYQRLVDSNDEPGQANSKEKLTKFSAWVNLWWHGWPFSRDWAMLASPQECLRLCSSVGTDGCCWHDGKASGTCHFFGPGYGMNTDPACCSSYTGDGASSAGACERYTSSWYTSVCEKV